MNRAARQGAAGPRPSADRRGPCEPSRCRTPFPVQRRACRESADRSTDRQRATLAASTSHPDARGAVAARQRLGSRRARREHGPGPVGATPDGTEDVPRPPIDPHPLDTGRRGVLRATHLAQRPDRRDEEAHAAAADPARAPVSSARLAATPRARPAPTAHRPAPPARTPRPAPPDRPRSRHARAPRRARRRAAPPPPSPPPPRARAAPACTRARRRSRPPPRRVGRRPRPRPPPRPRAPPTATRARARRRTPAAPR